MGRVAKKAKVAVSGASVTTKNTMTDAPNDVAVPEAVAYHTTTGRPLRQSAGRKSLPAGFANTEEAIDSDSDDMGKQQQDGEAADIHSDDDSLTYSPTRKRSSSPPMTPDIVDDYPASPMILTATRDDVQSDTTTAVRPLRFETRLPGIAGPLIINITADALRQASAPSPSLQSAQSIAPLIGSKRLRTTPNLPNSTSVAGRTGFLDLPAELRNEVYRLAFIGGPFDFDRPNNFQRSAALLSTCRHVAIEGSSILYSENNFRFARNMDMRAQRWSTKTHEIGFSDIRFFLKSIGPTNVAQLRHVSLFMDDALPKNNPHLTTADERRFENDQALTGALRILAEHGRLRHLGLTFCGRRVFMRESEPRFYKIIKALRADTLDINNDPVWWGTTRKIALSARRELRESIVRKKNIYPMPEVNVDTSDSSDSSDTLRPPKWCTACGDYH